MKKHAYLIIAHQHFDMLKRLIAALDSEYADFYIHIDKRVKHVDMESLFAAAQKSCVTILRKYKISWGADTQVRCEMLLLEAAVKRGYDYYHLLSGADIPLKSARQIEDFFEMQTNSFIEFVKHQDMQAPERSRYYYPLQNLMGRPKKDAGFIYGLLDQVSYELVKLQKLMGIDRTKRAPFVYLRGSQWFSISDRMAEYVVKNKRMIRKYFYCGLASDETFLQSVAMASPLNDEVEKNNLRLIDWVRTEHNGCSPHTFTIEDYEMLTSSDKLFARKFDPDVDREIIDALYARLEEAKPENCN